MPMRDMLLPEYDQEIATTRRYLERVPADRADWRPHPKSMPLGQLAAHLAEVPGWVFPTMTQPSLDIAPPGGEPYQTAPFTGTDALVAGFDAAAAGARGVLAQLEDAALMEPWSLLRGGQVVMTMPRAAVLRGFILSHLVHHRAQLGVYLRLLDVPVPAAYGNSADDLGGM